MMKNAMTWGEFKRAVKLYGGVRDEERIVFRHTDDKYAAEVVIGNSDGTTRLVVIPKAAG